MVHQIVPRLSSIVSKLGFRRFVSTKAAESERKILIDGLKINFEKVGDKGPAVLCLPGALGYIESDFGPQLKGPLTQKYQLVAWDPPGYGKSRPPDRDFTGLNFYTTDAQLSHKLMQNLGFHKYSILGWSDGGITGIVQSSLFPGSVEKLIIWGANAFVTKEDVELYTKIFGDISTWNPKMLDPLIRVYGEAYTKTMLMGFVDAFVECYTHNDGDICKDHVPNVQCPTLIIHGAKDPLVGPEHPDYLHKYIPGSELYIMPDGKHNLHLRYADEFAALVEKFMDNATME